MRSGNPALRLTTDSKLDFVGPALLVLLLFSLNTLAQAADINVRTNPVYVLIGAVNVDVDIGLGSRWTAGPTLTIDAVLENAMVGMRINRYRQSRDANGWYTGLDVRYSPNGLMNGGELYSVRVLEHYQWQWDNFNLALGIGPDLRREDEVWALWPGTNAALGWRF